MKKLCTTLVILLFVLAIFPVFSETNTDDVYVKTIPIIKIYSHRLGYKVVYFNSKRQLSNIYVPMSWFTHAAGKAELVTGDEPDYPYFSIFWKNGKFDYIRLYVKSDMADTSWGVLTDTPDLEKKFDIDTIKLEF